MSEANVTRLIFAVDITHDSSLAEDTIRELSELHEIVTQLAPHVRHILERSSVGNHICNTTIQPVTVAELVGAVDADNVYRCVECKSQNVEFCYPTFLSIEDGFFVLSGRLGEAIDWESSPLSAHCNECDGIELEYREEERWQPFRTRW